MDARTHVTSWGIKVKAETYRDAGDEQRQHHPNIPPLHPPAVIWRREWEARQSLLLRRRAIPSTCNSAMRGRGRGRKKKRNRGGGGCSGGGRGRESWREGGNGRDSQTVTQILTVCLFYILYTQLPWRCCTSLSICEKTETNYTHACSPPFTSSMTITPLTVSWVYEDIGLCWIGDDEPTSWLFVCDKLSESQNPSSLTCVPRACHNNTLKCVQ